MSIEYQINDVTRPDGTCGEELAELRTRVLLAESENRRLLRQSLAYSRADYREDAKRCLGQLDADFEIGRQAASTVALGFSLPIVVVLDVTLPLSVFPRCEGTMFAGGKDRKWQASLQRTWRAADPSLPGIDRLFAEYLVEALA